MPKTQKKSGNKALLPSRPPKATGKRGIGPREHSGDLVEQDAQRQEKEEKKPRQARLPQMEDPQIEELEAKAEEYAAVRDKRMALTPQEKKLKDDLHALMKANNKQAYVRDGIEIHIVHESETVKVKVKKTSQENEW